MTTSRAAQPRRLPGAHRAHRRSVRVAQERQTGRRIGSGWFGGRFAHRHAAGGLGCTLQVPVDARFADDLQAVNSADRVLDNPWDSSSIPSRLRRRRYRLRRRRRQETKPLRR